MILIFFKPQKVWPHELNGSLVPLKIRAPPKLDTFVPRANYQNGTLSKKTFSVLSDLSNTSAMNSPKQKLFSKVDEFRAKVVSKLSSQKSTNTRAKSGFTSGITSGFTSQIYVDPNQPQNLEADPLLDTARLQQEVNSFAATICQKSWRR